MEYTLELVVDGEEGLHLRPSNALMSGVMEADEYDRTSLTVRINGKECRDTYDFMGKPKGTKIQVIVRGEQADEVLYAFLSHQITFPYTDPSGQFVAARERANREFEAEYGDVFRARRTTPD